MSESIAINCDCMEYMRTLPDKAFDLAVVDPPYGDGKADSMKRFVEMYNAIYGTETRSHIGNVERERTRRSTTGSGEGLIDTRVVRTGGGWSKKYGKKSLRGTLPRRKSILQNFSASHATR